MRIRDWSSDVCSSDLLARPLLGSGRHTSRIACKDKNGSDGDSFNGRPHWRWKIVCSGCMERRWRCVRNASACLHRTRSEEHTSELQSLMRISYAVFCLKKKTNTPIYTYTQYIYQQSNYLS